jgi:hypothetical protein
VSASKSSLVLRSLLALTYLLLVCVPPSNAATTQSQAASALSGAEGTVVSAYAAVSKADAAQANVTNLLVRLNEAGDALTHAHSAYRLGDYDSALEAAVLCQDKLEGFVTEADMLTEAALRDNSSDFLANVVGSIIWSLGIASLGLIVGVYLNLKYGKTRSEV